ncbi:MAG: PAS domain S-box protein [Capsulimonas sp.]|uniref:sensor histidine kinase n=1 Tax=Capsulimonas sp. TaxID=2494211 RepID=UPI003265D3BE
MTRAPDKSGQPIFPPSSLSKLEASPLKAILEHSDDAIFCKTLDNIVTLWSRGAERVYGYSPEEMIGQSVDLLLPPDRPGETKQLVERIVDGEQVEHFETTRVTRSGTAISVLLSITPLRDGAGLITGAVTIARDMSATKHAEAEAREADERLKPLEKKERDHAVVLDAANRVALGVLSQLTGVEALRHIAIAAKTLAGARYAAIGVARLDGQGLSEFVTVGLTPEEETLLGQRPKGIGILGHLLSRREPLRIDALASHPASVGFPPNHPPMESFLGVPICRGDAVVGSLYLTDKEGGGAFTEADEIAVQALGAYAAVAINSLEMLARQRGLVRGLIAAQEDERRAVAYDLHDGLTQYVMASQAHMEAFRRARAGDETVRAERELEQGLGFLKEAVSESRRLVNGLRSLALDDLGLAGALEQHLREEKARAGWTEAEFVHNIAGRRFDQTLETAVYRVAQEALTNARKHAAANHVRVLLLLENDGVDGAGRLSLEVRDWGQGFVPEDVEAGPGRVGLHSMAERVGLMNGSYHLVANLGEGVTVCARFPLGEEPSEEDRAAVISAAPAINLPPLPLTVGEQSREILALNSEMREINEQLLIRGLHQQTLADENRAIAEALQDSLARSSRPYRVVRRTKRD